MTYLEINSLYNYSKDNAMLALLYPDLHNYIKITLKFSLNKNYFPAHAI